MGAAQFRQIFLQPLQSNRSSQFPPPRGHWRSHLQCKGDAHREGTDLVCRRVSKLLSGTDSYSDPFCRAAARGDFFSVSHSNDDILSCVYKWISDSPALVVARSAPEETVTSSFASFIHAVRPEHLSKIVRYRSKRMILDSIGVGLVGSTTHVFDIALKYCLELYSSVAVSNVYGKPGVKLSPTLAAFTNGVATHSMDFDDTWHPATHPSGAVLPALLAASQMLPPNSKPNGLDFLLAFNVGLEVQGRLMHFSTEAHNIPKRFHPPSVVGTMGSAAATAKLLCLNMTQCTHALGIAASLAGAPMANAATQAKPLHIGNATRLGFEAALLAARGMEANPFILDDISGCSGFSAFYSIYQPRSLSTPNEHHEFLLEKQDIAFKRFPAHLGMHWVVDAALSVRNLFINYAGSFSPSLIRTIVLKVPVSKYINRPFPNSEHEARHSFQFNACTALLDGEVGLSSFTESSIHRQELRELLHKVVVEHPEDNVANFDKMYGEVAVLLKSGDVLTGKCDTFYGHWRKPLSRESLLKKFRSNASHVLPEEKVETIITMVDNLENLSDSSHLACSL
ncbi:cis-aconitate decarboxylase-like isoform X1 [Gallus gallus]|uniref:Cis-aconitate decarboxylase n=1 Tax=Gallus gallus TaxID=9031 RepID=A0A8V0YD38_CHICK|nr:cis-aconitate decarboxylase-like isoform X1 [Gallus gallus]XP_040555218.1 cis-aconitate decarboxylase-like isoform X1 [Gallus gallus]